MSEIAGPSPNALSPYVVATSAVAARLDPSPGGRPIAPEHRFDPLRQASAPFLHRVEQLDAAEYGPLGMQIPRWALYDCAELPGFIAGLGAPSEEGLNPCSMVIGIPRMGERRWLVYATCGATAALRFATLALGLRLIGAGDIGATLQWNSPELAMIAHFAPLELKASWLPAHDVPDTCVVDFTIDAARIDRALEGPLPLPTGAARLNVRDREVLRHLQRTMASGRRIALVGSPEIEGEALWVPFSIGEET